MKTWTAWRSIPILLPAWKTKGKKALVLRDLMAGVTYPVEVPAPQVPLESNLFWISVHTPNGQVRTSTKRISHDHIPWTYNIQPLAVQVNDVQVKTLAKKVGYVMGAGDRVPEAMGKMGIEVQLIDPAAVTAEELQGFDAVVFGIRALNTLVDINNHMDKFYAYAKAGGNLVMQYNTAHRLKTDKIGPEGEIKLSRGRVTEENAYVFIVEDHMVLHNPNDIGEEDWLNWVQERGIVFCLGVDL